jgi:hypothetical protein
MHCSVIARNQSWRIDFTFGNANRTAFCRREITNVKEPDMRTSILVFTATAAVLLASPAIAQDARYHAYAYGAPVAGAAVGTAVGVGLYNGWWSSAGLPTSVAGSVAVGGLAGIGTAALLHAATTPCQGFHALFGNFLTRADGCVNGRWVGHQPARIVHRRR